MKSAPLSLLAVQRTHVPRPTNGHSRLQNNDGNITSVSMTP